VQTLIEGVGQRLSAAGLPLMRFFIGVPTVSPEFRAGSVSWDRERGFAGAAIRHGEDEEVFRTSPFRSMMDEEVNFRRWRLAGRNGPTGHPMVDGLAERGATDYLAFLVSFDDTGTRMMRGAALSFATDHPEGFSDGHVATLSRLVPLLGLSALRFATSSVLDEMLGCYVGRNAGDRILRGEIRRGEGHVLHAALLFADLRGFTGVAETGGLDVVPRLGEHLSAMAEPVEAAGGEILKILGDGLLAAFPIAEGETPARACAAALAAARDAVVRNAAVNAARPAETPLELDVALHRGEVFYGNIGAGSRLDFTTIGPAVNEVSRIEALCRDLDCPILMSESFASCCGAGVVSLGRHRLRGVAAERELFGIA
jgi:adenylate cyclase